MIKIKIQDQKHKYSMNQIFHIKLTKPMNNQYNQI